MKKKIKLVIKIAIALLVLGLVNLNFSIIKNDNTSSLMLENIEALASGGIILECYKTISTVGDGNLTHVTYCTDCDAHLARSWSSKGYCE